MIADIVAHIRSYQTLFAAVVAAGSPEQAETLLNLAMPCCIVIPMGYESDGGNANLTGFYQTGTETFTALVVIGNVSDRTGLQSAIVNYDTAVLAMKMIFNGYGKIGWAPRGYSIRKIDNLPTDQTGAKAFYAFTIARELRWNDSDAWLTNEVYLAQAGVVTPVTADTITEVVQLAEDTLPQSLAS